MAYIWYMKNSKRKKRIQCAPGPGSAVFAAYKDFSADLPPDLAQMEFNRFWKKGRHVASIITCRDRFDSDFLENMALNTH
jgi:hypothetical protein